MITLSIVKGEVILWSWDEVGNLVRMSQIKTSNERPILDVAIHPSGKTIAVVGRERPIELYSLPEGILIRSMGDVTTLMRPVRTPYDVEVTIDNKTSTKTIYEEEVPLTKQGYTNVVFSPSGDQI